MNTESNPATRPILGQDLDALRDQLGLSSSEACWLYGLSMTKWSKVVRSGAKVQLSNRTLALLVRIMRNRPDLNLLPRAPGAQEIFDRLHEVDPDVDKKRLSILFGCEASSGYRWITLGSELSPALMRLFTVFSTLYDRARVKGIKATTELLNEWRAMVETEANQRGVSGIFSHGRWVREKNGPIVRPIIGEDLDALREELGLSTMDACWLFGLSMTKWSQIAKGKGSKTPLPNITLALLVRALRAHPDASPVKRTPEAQEVFEAIQLGNPDIDRKRMAIMFGRESSSGYRWLTTNSRLSPALMRLFTIFMLLQKEAGKSLEKNAKLINDWDEMVALEARTRGVNDVFRVGRWIELPETEDKKPKRARRSKSAEKATGETGGLRAARAAAKKSKLEMLPPAAEPAKPVARKRVPKAGTITVTTPEEALVSSVKAPARKKAARQAV